MTDNIRPEKVVGPDGVEVECNSVRVIQSVERFSEVSLEDGTIFRIKPTVTKVLRLKEKWDDAGNPVYVIGSQNIVVLDSASEEFKKVGGQ